MTNWHLDLNINWNTIKENNINESLSKNIPNETISSIRFSPSSNLIAVSSWNNTITCYKYNTNHLLENNIWTFNTQKFEPTKIIGINKHDRAVLCCCWNSSGSYIFSGGCDEAV